MDIEKILTNALNAPSGDNCQPWRFVINESFVDLYNDIESDKSLYNYSQFASVVANGALIENIKISASHHKTKTQIDLFPDAENQNHIANIRFSPSAEKSADGEMFHFIAKRTTNRKRYDGRVLSEEILNQLHHEPSGVVDVKVVTNKDAIEKLSYAVSRNEQLVIGNPYLHEFLFQHVRWSQSDMNRDRNGLFIDTLEMNGFQKMIFKLASSWNRVKLMNKLGLGLKIASENQQTYQTSSAFIAVYTDNATPLSYVETGRTIQRLWLKATQLGLSIHPLNGIVFLHNRPSAGESEYFQPKEKAVLDKAYGILQNEMGIPKDGVITFMFRLGYSEEPSATSIKMTLDSLIRT